MKLLLAATLILMPVLSFATDATKAVENFVESTGSYTELDHPGTTCNMEIDGDSKSIIIKGIGASINSASIEDSVTLDSESSSQDLMVFNSSDDGKKLQGNLCGKLISTVTRYKKQLIVNNKDQIISIRSTFRCPGKLYQKYTLDFSCRF